MVVKNSLSELNSMKIYLYINTIKSHEYKFYFEEDEIDSSRVYVLFDKVNKKIEIQSSNICEIEEYINICLFDDFMVNESFLIELLKQVLQLYLSYRDMHIECEYKDNDYYLVLYEGESDKINKYFDDIQSIICYVIEHYDFSIKILEDLICPNCNFLYKDILFENNVIIYQCGICNTRRIELL